MSLSLEADEGAETENCTNSQGVTRLTIENLYAVLKQFVTKYFIIISHASK